MKYTIKTSGLHCGHCDASVESALLKLDGVTDADADHETNTVELETSAPVAEEAIKEAVRGAGDNFDVVSIQAA